MKNLFLFIAFLFFTALSFAQSQVWVNGYYRSNGTYVQGHYRTAPDHTVNNNWTRRGNTNPHTQQPGYLPRSSSSTSTTTNYQPSTKRTYTNTYTRPASTYVPAPVYLEPNYSTSSYSTSTFIMPACYSSTNSTPSYNMPSYSSKTIYTGPRGGTYHINSNGNKTYVR
jgi:hypothetical protein